MSASTKKSKELASLRKEQGRGHGYFGDNNDKDKDFEKQKSMKSNFLVKTETKQADATGAVTFYNLPIGKY